MYLEDMDTPYKIARVQERAYYLWLNEGRPKGRDLRHWLQAEREVFIEEKRELAEKHLGPRPSSEAELMSIKIRPISGSDEGSDSYPELVGDLNDIRNLQESLLGRDDLMLVLHETGPELIAWVDWAGDGIEMIGTADSLLSAVKALTIAYVKHLKPKDGNDVIRIEKRTRSIDKIVATIPNVLSEAERILGGISLHY
jgi:hypothetical protein